MICYPFSEKSCEVFTDTRPVILVEEGKKKYIASNNNYHTVCLAHVDGCLIIDGVKCDYLLLKCVETDKTAYFIELKGQDLLHAIDQIDRSIDLLYPKLSLFKINARIVLSKVHAPDLKSNKYKRLEDKLKKLKGTLLKKEKVLEEKI